MLKLNFPSQALTDDEIALKYRVREFLRDYTFGSFGGVSFGLGDGGIDKEFSQELGRRGWIGMSLPSEYGGVGGTAVERLVVTEELLAAGAPVGYHWVADRQSGPSIAANGTEGQKREFLPRIASGDLSFAIGMSEPDAGSDLAAVKTKAETIDEKTWRVNGSKIWTSNAREATHMLCLFRTSSHKHQGLTQFIVDTSLPGIEIRPIRFIDGSSAFNEIFFTDVKISDDMRLGEVGAGWGQNRSELALERGGIDRWFSMITFIDTWMKLKAREANGRASSDRLLRLSALAWTCRGLSLSIARAVDQGKQPVNEAALVKDYATQFEQICVAEIQDDLFSHANPDSSLEKLREAMKSAQMVAPSWTIRGGTNQILRRIVSKAILSDASGGRS